MMRFRDLSIRWKLTATTIAGSGLALLLASAAFVVYDLVSFTDGMVRRLSGEADIVGLSSATAVLFRDPKAATEMIAGLRVEPEIRSAAIYDSEGRLFASYVRAGLANAGPPAWLPQEPSRRASVLESDRLIVTRRIDFEGARVGTVFLESDLSERTDRLRRYGGIVGLVFLGSLAAAAFLGLRVQRGISAPLLDLAGQARRVSEGKDLSTRVSVPGQDEIGVLVRTFNEMLEGLQRRDTELASAHQELEQRLEERTALHQRAEEANRLKDQFLATLSHELRTPLQAIIGWGHLLRSGGVVGEQGERALDTIVRNAKAQQRLIEDLLDTSRILSGALRLQVSRVEPAPMADAAIEAVRLAAESKGVRLQVVLDRATGPVLGDGNRLQQVVWNLLSNAIKFTPPGGRVQVSLARVNSHIEISVADTGVGMPAEFLPHAFERFRQADSSSTRQHAGLGLGLAIVKQIVELHSGTVEAESAGPGRGSVFTVKLPLMVVSVLFRPPAGEGRSAQSEGPGASLDGLRVLVVDDDHDTVALVAAILEGRGATVVRAHSAAEARKRIAGNDIQVMVSDIEMPEEDGYDLIRSVRRLDPMDGGMIPAVALTAYAHPQDRIAALQAGFALHVAKPVDPEELLAVVASLGGKAGRRGPDA